MLTAASVFSGSFQKRLNNMVKLLIYKPIFYTISYILHVAPSFQTSVLSRYRNSVLSPTLTHSAAENRGPPAKPLPKPINSPESWKHARAASDNKQKMWRCSSGQEENSLNSFPLPPQKAALSLSPVPFPPSIAWNCRYFLRAGLRHYRQPN